MIRKDLKRLLTATSVMLILNGCAFFGGDDRAPYERASETRPLEVPPDLSAPPIDSRMSIPSLDEERVSAVETARLATKPDAFANWAESAGTPAEQVLPRFADMRVRRQGGARWLEIDADPAALWPKLHDFWSHAGVELAREEPQLGIMQSEWIEPFGEGALDTGMRDQYRLRLERQDADTTNVYITHRGTVRTGSNEAARWEPRSSDLGLEAEYLTRLMVYLGESRQQAEQQVASAEPDGAPMRLDRVAGIPVLVVEDQFSRVWPLTGVALDRAGLPVEEEDVVNGTYYFRYRPAAGQSVGVLTGRVDKAGNANLYENGRYQVHLLDQPGQTLITAQSGNRESLAPAAAEEILKRLIASMQGGGGQVSSEARFSTLPARRLDGV